MIGKQISQVLAFLQLHGRTVADEKRNALFFNWTCSGFTVHFTGKTLKAELCSMGEKPQNPMLEQTDDAPLEMPWIAVIADDGRTIVRRIECKEPCAWYTLWDAPKEAEHTLRIVKLSENSRGKVGLRALETDGILLPVSPTKKKLHMEFVGDSITCGFGNEARTREDPFTPKEENGWTTYAALAARTLDAEFSCISVSGISVSKGKTPRVPFDAMEDVYEYTDCIYDKKAGQNPKLWDFGQNKKDIVVLNLGTNDVNPVRFAPDFSTAMEEETYFGERYKLFLQTLRRCNGPDTWICCTLGPLDYYLFDNIQEAVAEYKDETGDEHICCFKLIGVNLLTEGFGAVGEAVSKVTTKC